MVEVVCGESVVQGSILVPMLFLLYTADVNDIATAQRQDFQAQQ